MEGTIPRSVARTMTGISWTDFTGNPWIGCTAIPAGSGARSGCSICYAKTYGETRLGVGWGAGVSRHRFTTFSARMHRLDRLAKATGSPFAVFSLSLGDWLDGEVDAGWRRELFDVVEACENLTWLLLTHRPQLARKLAPASWRQTPPENLWSGVTIDHPAHAYRWDQHADYWAHTGRAWISAEPLAASLEPVRFSDFATMVMGGASNTDDPSWEFDERWVLEAVERYGEPRIYYKQRGDIVGGTRVGKKAAGRTVAGRTFDTLPWPTHRERLSEAAG